MYHLSTKRGLSISTLQAFEESAALIPEGDFMRDSITSSFFLSS